MAAILCTDLGLFKLQVFTILYGKINVLQDNVDALLISAVKGQETNHTVIINLKKNSAILVIYYRMTAWKNLTLEVIMKDARAEQLIKIKNKNYMAWCNYQKLWFK